MYRLIYDYRVADNDISALSTATKQRVQKAIKQKLTTHPDLYGIPLRRTLKGYRKLRVGDYRIIFKIDGATVKILMIGHRSTVYGLATKRW